MESQKIWLPAGVIALAEVSPELKEVKGEYYVPAAALDAAIAEERERVIKLIKSLYIYGPSNLSLEREGAIQARKLILEALARKGEGEAGKE